MTGSGGRGQKDIHQQLGSGKKKKTEQVEEQVEQTSKVNKEARDKEQRIDDHVSSMMMPLESGKWGRAWSRSIYNETDSDKIKDFQLQYYYIYERIFNLFNGEEKNLPPLAQTLIKEINAIEKKDDNITILRNKLTFLECVTEAEELRHTIQYHKKYETGTRGLKVEMFLHAEATLTEVDKILASDIPKDLPVFSIQRLLRMEHQLIGPKKGPDYATKSFVDDTSPKSIAEVKNKLKEFAIIRKGLSEHPMLQKLAGHAMNFLGSILKHTGFKEFGKDLQKKGLYWKESAQIVQEMDQVESKAKQAIKSKRR